MTTHGLQSPELSVDPAITISYIMDLLFWCGALICIFTLHVCFPLTFPLLRSPPFTFPHLRSPSHIFASTTFDLCWARTLSLSGAAGASGKSINSLFHSHGQWGKVLTGEFAFAAQNILKYAAAEVHTFPMHKLTLEELLVAKVCIL